jgi:hypothetical protein
LLSETDPKSRSKSVRKDFGDCKESFEEWWPGHKHLFEELPRDTFVVDILESVEDFKHYNDDPYGVLTVAINVFSPKNLILKKINELTQQLYVTEAGRPKAESWAYLYQLNGGTVSEPQIAALRRALDVYRTWKREGKRKGTPGGLKKYEVAIKHGLIPAGVPIDSDTAKIISDKRKNLTDRCGKYLEWADRIKENVAIGVFPAKLRE